MRIASVVMNYMLIQEQPVETNPFTPSSSLRLSLTATAAPIWDMRGNISVHNCGVFNL